MQNLPRSEGLDLPPIRPAVRSQRSSSISNDRASLSVASLPFPPAVNPDPAYIAPSSASQIVTGDHDPILDEEDEEEESNGMGLMNARVAPNALHLVNAFLDQLLYSFLASSRSTAITSLRPAVAEVLKPRLAKDAIASADAELQEFLGDEDYDDLSVYQQGIEPRGGWDLNLVWRRTRLRCMVYTRLGDLEEEDEEMWVERENVGQKADGRNRLSRDLGVVSPTSAIFLTSILEFIGEEVLRIAGNAAYARFEAKRRHEKHSAAQSFDPARPLVEVFDIEKLAVNTTFGRLWRSWKKKVRSPSISSQRPPSCEHLFRPASSLSTSESRSRKDSVGDHGAHFPDPVTFRRPLTAEDRERISEAAIVPLPVSRDDTNEVEGRGPSMWTSHPELGERPRSVMIGSDASQRAHQPNGYHPVDTWSGRPGLLHNRSSSLPHLVLRRFSSTQTSPFPSTQKVPSFDASQRRASGHSRLDSDPAAVSTMYDGAIDREESVKETGVSKITRQPNLVAQRQETQDLDDGADSLAHASDRVDKPILGDLTQGDGLRERQSYLNDPGSVNEVGMNEQVPAENRAEPKQMQGYPNRNVPLDNHKASIVESALSHGFDNKSFVNGGVSDSRTLGLDSRDRQHPADTKGPSPDANLDSATEDYGAQNHGYMPRSYPEANADTVPDLLPTFPQTKAPTSISDIRKQLPPVSTGVERAAVQRVSPSPGSTVESPVGRTSTSSNRELRALHTSGSSTSQKAAKIKGLVGRDSSDTSRQFAVSRTSSEGSGSIAPKTPRVDEAQQSFEQLIKSDETIQYTLTPRSVREIDSPESPRTSHSRTATADLADFIRTSGPPPAETNRPPTSRSIKSLKGLDALRSNPAPMPAPMPAPSPILENPGLQDQRAKPPTTRPLGAPREPTMKNETTRDFADFIRSTGPEANAGLSQRDGVLSPPPASTSRPNEAMTAVQRSLSGSYTGKKITKPTPNLYKPSPPVSNIAPPKRTTSKLQAREAIYEPTHNEDLLDFLKQGPAEGSQQRPTPGPVASIVQNPKVTNNMMTRPRTSENTRSSVASTHDSSFADMSIRSANSRTGLLDSPRGGGGQQNNSRSPPARKQRRVRDPYAIDTDSEDEDEEDRSGTPKAAAQRPGQGQPESLIDFLNSTAPPSETTITASSRNPNPKIPSAFDDVPNPLAVRGINGAPLSAAKSSPSSSSKALSSGSMTPRVATTPGIRSADAKTASSLPPVQRGRAPVNTNSSNNQRAAPQLPPLNSRDISPHLTGTFPPVAAPSSASPFPAFSPPNSHGAATANSGTTTTNGVIPQQQRKKPPGVARAEREPQRGMGDLADFLRNSEPPMGVPEEFRARTTSGGGGGGVQGRGEERDGKGGGVWGRLKEKGRRKGSGAQ